MASISASGPVRGRAAGPSLRTRAAPRRRGRGHAARAATTSSTSSTRCAAAGDDGLRGRIVSVTPETAESATILVKPGRDWAGHVPGQYVRVGVDVDGVRLWRTYSLTHGPRRDRCLSFTVKAIPGGVVSNHLVHRARAGQMIQLEQAEGEFVLPDADPAQAAAGHRRLRHHAGDRDAAQPVLPPGAGRHRHHARARQPDRVRRDLPRRAARRTPPPATSGWSSGTTTATASSTSTTSTSSCPTSTSGSPTPAARPACSTRSRSTTPTAASR